MPEPFVLKEPSTDDEKEILNLLRGFIAGFFRKKTEMLGELFSEDIVVRSGAVGNKFPLDKENYLKKIKEVINTISYYNFFDVFIKVGDKTNAQVFCTAQWLHLRKRVPDRARLKFVFINEKGKWFINGITYIDDSLIY